MLISVQLSFINRKTWVSVHSVKNNGLWCWDCGSVVGHFAYCVQGPGFEFPVAARKEKKKDFKLSVMIHAYNPNT